METKIIGTEDRTRLVVVVAVLVLVLGGVAAAGLMLRGRSGPEPAAKPTTPTVTFAMTGPPSATGTGATAAASPPLPSDATDKNDAGAVAFLQHFFDVYNYAFQSLDDEAVAQLGSSECAFCKSAASTVAEIRGKGAHVEGGRVSVQNAIAQPGGSPERGVVVNSLLAQEAGSTVGADGAPISTSKASKRRLDALVRWKEGRWVLVGVDTATR